MWWQKLVRPKSLSRSLGLLHVVQADKHLAKIRKSKFPGLTRREIEKKNPMFGQLLVDIWFEMGMATHNSGRFGRPHLKTRRKR